MPSADSPLLRELGDRFRARRVALGLTQQELAAMACYSRSTVANFEQGRQDMPVTQLALFVYLLGLDLDVFFMGVSVRGLRYEATAVEIAAQIIRGRRYAAGGDATPEWST